MPNPHPASLRCPTCRAQQAWSDTCRRCKCDLRLLRAADEAYEGHRVQCLIDLRDNRPLSAIACARECDRLRPGDESRKLLAVCALIAGDWATAMSLAE
ncbi:MAG TPA: hypothetical protein VGH74_15065 [Planctomycetaceae bacterium]|jgi:hypothetical protein